MIWLSVLVLVLWHQPWSATSIEGEVRTIAEARGQPVAIVEADRFEPEWLRVEPGGCIHLVSRSDRAFAETLGTLDAGSAADWCFAETGVERVTLGERAFSGGFVHAHE